MELRQFVKTALLDLVHGVRDAQKEIEGTGAEIAPRQLLQGDRTGQWYASRKSRQPLTPVKFDVAVTAEDTAGTKGGGEVKLGVFSVGLGSQDTAVSKTVTRIQFEVHVVWPCDIKYQEQP